jgi:methylglyoxal synthase
MPHIGSPEKTLVGILASHDDPKPNESLVSLFTHLVRQSPRNKLCPFHFVFTGGTHDRVFYGDKKLGVPALDNDVADWLRAHCGVTRLPPTGEGGVIILSYLISQRECSIVWPFYAPNNNHWQRNENLAFMRLCDQWHVKRLMNRGSVLAWFDMEAESDAKRNLQKCPPQLQLQLLGGEVRPFSFPTPPAVESWRGRVPVHSLNAKPKDFSAMTIALIAHDEMKGRMIEFAIDHETELDKFHTILATGTTGREVAAATSHKIDKKMIRYHSGPKGGDIEIATMILHGLCDVVIFFVDPLRAHPHIEDIRVVFQACMVKDQVVMITNEMHAREFMGRVVRGNQQLTLYEPIAGPRRAPKAVRRHPAA